MDFVLTSQDTPLKKNATQNGTSSVPHALNMPQRKHTSCGTISVPTCRRMECTLPSPTVAQQQRCKATNTRTKNTTIKRRVQIIAYLAIGLKWTYKYATSRNAYYGKIPLFPASLGGGTVMCTRTLYTYAVRTRNRPPFSAIALASTCGSKRGGVAVLSRRSNSALGTGY